MRGLGMKLGLSAAAVTLCLAMVEGMMAILGRYPPQPYWHVGELTPSTEVELDPLVGWTIGPDRVATTEWSSEFNVTYRSAQSGFRVRDAAMDESRSVPVVFIGDSFTFGDGVEYEETFAFRVGEALSVPIRNLGMSGFGVDQIWQTFVHFGRQLEPRVVVMAYVDDDLPRSMSAYRWRGSWWAKPTFDLVDDRLVPQRAADRPTGLARFVARRSRLVQMWRAADRNISRRNATGRIWELNAAIFRAVQEDARAVGAHLLVVRIPEKWQDTGSPASAILAGMGIDVLDLGEWLPDPRSQLYYELDPHLNAAGHEWAAERIAEHLSKSGVLSR
jgi:hypothetical protein